MPACGLFVSYQTLIDWNNDGDYGDTKEDTTADVLMRPISWSYGRDQARALSPAMPGEAKYTLCNSDYSYSPGGTSPIAANVIPGRPILIKLTPTTGGPTVTGFGGWVDNLDIHSERNQRNVDLDCIDGLARLDGIELTTSLFQGIRTGDAISAVLDAAGWPAALRSIDSGASYLPYWWLDKTNAANAIQDLIKAEGPPSICYVRGGIITFKDRTHRSIDTNTLTSQNTYCVADSLGCVAPTPCAGGSLVYTDPFMYDHGLKNIINKASFSVTQRSPDAAVSDIFTTDEVFTIAASGSIQVIAQMSDPFTGAITPLDGIDFQTITGSATATLSRTSGLSTLITLTAGGSTTQVTNLRVRGISHPVRRTTQVTTSDATSITKYGEQSFPDEIPWVNALDAKAIANRIVEQRKDRVPVVQIRTANKDQTHENAMIARDVSDLVTIRNDRLGVNTTFYVEKVEHVMEGVGQRHTQTLGCEQLIVTPPDDLFIFGGGAGHRFNEGVFAE